LFGIGSDHDDMLQLEAIVLKGDLQSRTAVRLVREWIDLRYAELLEDWELARQGEEIKKIEPLQ
jgi:hypothetical protein